MSQSISRISESYLKALIAGDRAASRELIESATASGVSAEQLLSELRDVEEVHDRLILAAGPR